MYSYNHLLAGVNHASQTRKLYLAFLTSKLKHDTAKLFTLKCVTCSSAEFPENAIMFYFEIKAIGFIITKSFWQIYTHESTSFVLKMTSVTAKLICFVEKHANSDLWSLEYALQMVVLSLCFLLCSFCDVLLV